MSPPLLLWAVVLVTLCRPAAATILVVEQHDDSAEYQMEDSPSRFGPRAGMAGVSGQLVLSAPLDACWPVAPPPSTPAHHHQHWLLLAGDGNCSSGQKVLNAQRAGYVAAIVFNVTGDGFQPMKSGIHVEIPSFYIGLTNGIMLRSNFLYGSGYLIYISGYFPYTFLAFIIPAMLLVMLCMLVLIAIMLYRCISEYRRTARRLLPKRMLAQIPTRRYAAPTTSAGGGGGGGGTTNQETCAICLDDYQEGDQLRLLPCGHAFHCGCVDPWLLRSRRVCPVCKRRLVSATVAVLVSESEDEQLLPVYRSQRLPAARRSYGATLNARVPPPVATVTTVVGEPGVSTRPRSGRRPRRLSRRRSGVQPAAPPNTTAADVTTAANDVTTTADDVRPLADGHKPAELPSSTASPAGDTGPTVAPCGGALPKLQPGQYRRLEEVTDNDVATGAETRSNPTPAVELQRPKNPSPPRTTPSPSPSPPPPTPGADIV